MIVGAYTANQYYADTTAAAAVPPDKESTTAYMYLLTDKGVYISGVPVAWASNAPGVYEINPRPPKAISPGMAWVVGSIVYAGKTLKDSTGVQVVAGPELVGCH